MNVTASLQIKNDKYFIVLNYPIDGKRKQKWVGTNLSSKGNNKRKAEQMRLNLLNEWRSNADFLGNDILFSDYLSKWLNDTKNTISENTYYSYLQTVNNSICPYFAKKKIKLNELKPYHIIEFYNFKMKTDEVSANTIHHYHANIHKSLDYAVKTGRIRENPSDNVDLPKKEKHIADFYSVEELKTLLDKSKNTPLETVILLAAWFGLRRGEIIGLKWNCIDFANKTLSVRGTITDKGTSGSKIKNMTYRESAKNNSSIRTFPLPDDAVKYLKDLKSKQEQRLKSSSNYNNEFQDFVCVRNNGDLIPLEYVSRAFPRFCTQCGLRRIKLHELRHTNISMLVQSGANMKEIQEWAGHSNYNTTANIYAHIQAQSKLKLADNISSLINNG